MAKNRFDIGEVVAAQMQQIIDSDDHKRIFFNKKASEDKCCSCSTCGKDCPCDKCKKDCKGCEDKGHIHDSNCTHDQKTGAVNEMLELLSKISAAQDELGLTKSSLVTMQALATMVTELRKIAQEDTNDVSYGELIEGLKRDPSEKASGYIDYDEYPEIAQLLKQRIEESERGGVESVPTDIFEEVSADPATIPPSSEIFPPSIVNPPVSGEISTWGPTSSKEYTDLPPLPSPSGEEKIPHMPPVTYLTVPVERPVRPKDRAFKGFRAPAPVNVVDLSEQISTKELSPEDQEYRTETKTVPTPREAFQKLNELLTKQAQEEYADFEEEPTDEADELEALMRSLPDADSNQQMRGHELEELLMNEEDDDSDRHLFGLDEGYADDMMASDLDEELEFGDFLVKPEDGGPGFTYGPGETYPNVKFRKNPSGLFEEYEEPERYRSPDDIVRIGPGEWKKFEDLSPQERLEHEMGAGLHEQLEIDPDQLSDEEVYPDTYEFGDSEDLIADQISDKISHDPSDDDYDYKQSHFWGSNE